MRVCLEAVKMHGAKGGGWRGRLQPNTGACGSEKQHSQKRSQTDTSIITLHGSASPRVFFTRLIGGDPPW